MTTTPITSTSTLASLTLLLLLLGLAPLPAQDPTTAPPSQPVPKAASFTFSGNFPATESDPAEPALIFSTHSVVRAVLQPQQARQTHDLSVKVIQGKLKELVFLMTGQDEPLELKGTSALDWGVRRNTNGQQFLVIHIQKGLENQTNYNFTITTQKSFTNAPYSISLTAFSPLDPTFSDGYVKIDHSGSLDLSIAKLSNLTPIERQFFPGDAKVKDEERKLLTFRFSGQAHSLTLTTTEADPDRRKIRFNNFNLSGTLQGDIASFTLTGTAQVNHPDGGTLDALSGSVALTSVNADPNVQLALENGRYRFKFAKDGTYQITLKFDAQVTDQNGWKTLAFTPPPSALRPVTIKGLSADTQVRFIAAADAKRDQDQFQSYLPAAGALQFQWQEARPDVEGKLFFAASAASEVRVSPQLVRQTTLLDYRVMQGELQQLILSLEGQGQVTRVQGDGILTWNEEGQGDTRRLIVQLNQARKDSYSLAIQTKTELGALPLAVKPIRIIPVGAIRFGGHIRIVNIGAVRLEVLNAPGLAQISPQRFPDTTALGQLTEQQQAQAFAFRFSGPEYDLEIQADNVLPELTLSQLLIYHLGETESTIDAELELEIREAPLREFTLTVPADYELAYHNPELGDHTLGQPDANGATTLTIQFVKPLIGRQVIQFRLSRSHTAPEASWPLFPVRALKVKSVRGYVGASADAGLRLTATQTGALTEIATAFFPKKIPDLQLAYRLRDPDWTATLSNERLALSIQTDSLQLFSIGEGLAYGSSILNYLIAGAPVSSFKVQVPSNYANVEFIGKDIRDRKQVEGGYEVYLHTPVSGTYSLLATFDIQFNPRGEELAFNGIQPLDVQSEQGHIIVISTYQFETEPVNVSSGLIKVEPGEIPTEYRLLFDAPMLAAYQFTSRPFDLRLRLTSLSQGETVNQVIDRATFLTRVSAEGQTLTEITYLIKTKGHSHLRLAVPDTTLLRQVHVNNTKVVPVTDQTETLIPLPQNIPPNTVIPVRLQVASKSEDASRVTISLPVVASPILLADWKIEPDPAYQLDFRSGNISPIQSPGDISGFAWISGMLDGRFNRLLDLRQILLIFVGALVIGVGFCRWATREGHRRFDLKNCVGLLFGSLSLILSACALVALISFAAGHGMTQSSLLAFMVPIQAPNTALQVALRNREIADLGNAWLIAWPAYLGLFAWGYALVTQSGRPRQLCVALGWTLIAWGTLRLPNGAPAFLTLVAAFSVIHIALPLYLRQARLPRKPRKPAPTPEPTQPLPPPTTEPDSPPPTDTPSGPTTGGATTALLLISAVLLAASPASAATKSSPPALPQSTIQQARVVENHVFIQAELSWNAQTGQSLDFLKDPAVLTKIEFPESDLKLVQDRSGKTSVYRLTAQKSGSYTIRFDYEITTKHQKDTHGFLLPTPFGLINQLTLTLDQADLEMASPHAVSVKTLPAPAPPAPATKAGSTRFQLVLAPVENAWVAWKPRSRDTSTETTVFHAELFQLIIPTAGVIEGSHVAQIQPSQGQIKELIFQTPENLTITDVQAQNLSNWRFDPDTQKLRVQFEPPHTRQFVVSLQSQITTSPLPFEKQLGLVNVEGAASQIGMVGIATGADVQLDPQLTPVNLIPGSIEDFPASVVNLRSSQVNGLRVRKAFGSKDTAAAQLTIKASAVQPDIRVQTQQTLSLGEDRTVLAVRMNASITKAGVFKLSFTLPTGMDVESLTGPALSHWTELSAANQRIITMHLKGKTEGSQPFSITLTGPGAPAGTNWLAPRLILREASKETGQIIVVPEQGMRLTTDNRDGVTQLDPKDAGDKRKGVLAFRLLRPDWQLNFDIEKVDPWVHVVTLQDVTLREGQIKASATLEYNVENAGVKSFFVQMPTNAEAVVFSGEGVSDSVKSDDPVNDSVEWEIKLHRRVIGTYKLQVSYQVASNDNPQETIAGIQAKQVNLQRGYITLRTSGRLQLGIPVVPPALQPAEWRSIPVSLRGSKTATEGNYTFRAIEPDFRLNVTVIRHDAAKLLPARVLNTQLTSALSDVGEMLTQVTLNLQPGDKRLLQLQLPPGARFWFAFVNNASVWPWQKDNRILIPLEQNSKPDQAVTVDFLYSISTSSKKGQVYDFALLGPQFDLPLENISWHVFLPQGRDLDDWDSGLQLAEQTFVPVETAVDLQAYINQENTQQRAQTEEAESLLKLGNTYLNRGQQKEARQAFSSAWTLSQHDDAFNEDARVQLQNLKMQQALVGLNYRRNVLGQDPGQVSVATNAAINILGKGRQARYTQQQVQEALVANSAEDNTALIRLAEQLVEQQDAAQAAPEAIRATLPTHGKRLTFTRSLQVDSFANLSIDLETRSTHKTSGGSRMLLLFGLFVSLFILMAVTKKPAQA